MAFGDVVQSNTGTGTTATTSPTLPSAVTAGNLVVLTFAADDYNGTPNAGWTQSTGMEQQTFHGGYLWWFIASSNGQTIPSYTVASAVRSAWNLVEYAGPFNATPYDVSNGQFQQASAITYTTPTITPTAGSRLIVGNVNFQQSQVDLAAPGSWTNSFTQASGSVFNGANPRLAVGQASLVVTASGSTGYSTGATMGTSQVAGSESGLIIAFKAGSSGGTSVTGTARVGGSAWGGVKAASAASILAMATVGGLTWSGVQANSTTTTPRTDATRIGTLAWSGVRAQSASDTVHAARVGSLSIGGVSPILSIEDVVAGTGPGTIAWAGVRATSTALGGGVAHSAKLGALGFGGVKASSTSSTIAAGTVAGVTWSGVRAASTADLTSPTRLGFLGWSGVPAASTTAVVQNETARVGSWSWAGVSAVSATDVRTGATGGFLAWAGVPATSRATGPNLRDLDLAATVHPDRYAATLHGDRYVATVHPDRYRSST